MTKVCVAEQVFVRVGQFGVQVGASRRLRAPERVLKMRLNDDHFVDTEPGVHSDWQSQPLSSASEDVVLVIPVIIGVASNRTPCSTTPATTFTAGPVRAMTTVPKFRPPTVTTIRDELRFLHYVGAVSIAVTTQARSRLEPVMAPS